MKRTSKYLAPALGLVFVSLLATHPVAAAWDLGFVPSTQVVITTTRETTANTVETYCTDALKMINEERAKAGLAILEYSAGLKPAADIRAKEAATSFSHLRPDGRNVSTVFAEQGIAYKNAGETLAHGYATATELVAGWMNSETHKEVLLSAKFTSAALGYYQNADGRIYCSLLLCSPDLTKI